jgi:protein-L-isoaspartate(D-aspartate) O-methyltransferase
MAHVVGPTGRVLGIEVDADLAGRAADNLADTPSVKVLCGDGRAVDPGAFDAILVNAGVTHPEPAWLEALSPRGRIALPLTATLPGAPHPAGPAMSHIGKGLLVRLARSADPARFEARLLTFVAIYSAIGLRDAGVNAELGRALARMPFPAIRQFRLDPHESDAGCWCHSIHGCWST